MPASRTSPSPATATETARRLVDLSLAAWEPMFAALDDLWSGWGDLAGPSGRPGARPHPRHGHGRAHEHRPGCGCDGAESGADRCGCDHCRCCGCADDVDVLVEARVGERRLVPISVHNPRRRATTVTLTPGPWTSCSDGAPPVKAAVVPGGEVTLEPCETREVVLVLVIGEGQQEDPGAGEPRGDVRCCTVSTCDIALDGCGERVRVAVAVLPLDCGALDVTCCDCGCC